MEYSLYNFLHFYEKKKNMVWMTMSKTKYQVSLGWGTVSFTPNYLWEHQLL